MNAQSLKKANMLFNKMAYIEAAEAYEKIAKKNQSILVLKRLGDSYYFNHQMPEAVRWYSKLFSAHNAKNIDTEYLFRFGQALRAVGNYGDSDFWLNKFNQLKNQDARGRDFVENKKELKVIEDPEETQYKVYNVKGVNTEYSDFGATIIGDIIVYASPQRNLTPVKRTYSWNEQKFLDLYSVVIKDSIALQKSQSYSKTLNSPYHESTVAFSPDEQTIYFTRNNYKKGKYGKDKKGVSRLKLYSAQWFDGEWKNIKELPFCSDEYSVGHPAVSKDGKFLYFTSDMPGTFGKTDIFYVEIKINGSYGPIQQFGREVNSEGREMFPFVTDDGTLFFASDGRFGLGGLDIFRSDKKDGIYQNAVNLKSPINSKADDFGYVINQKTNQGFFSSNRAGGYGDDDIYSFVYTPKKEEIIETVEIEEKPCMQTVTGFVKDSKFKVPLNGARLVIKDIQNVTVKDTIVGKDGKFTFTLPCNQSYTAYATKEYYKPDEDTFQTTVASQVNLDLNFNLEIVDDFTYNDKNELVIKIKPIYFDVNKSNIRFDAGLELDKVALVMKKYPKLVIRSSSHTDAQGRAAYNEKLSDRRAKSTVSYIISQGISTDRISGKGFGETQLTNNCVDNDAHTNRVKCTAEQHQANRRTEFVIVKM